MAAIATAYFESGLSFAQRTRETNTELIALQPLRRRGTRTPEFYFARHIDNSRLMKAPDPVRVREMRLFSAAITVLFSLVMIYGLQHFSAIEGGYRVESEKQAVEQLREDIQPPLLPRQITFLQHCHVKKMLSQRAKRKAQT